MLYMVIIIIIKEFLLIDFLNLPSYEHTIFCLPQVRNISIFNYKPPL